MNQDHPVNHPSLLGKTALVTGANRNTGFGIAASFIEAGATVLAHARSIEKARATAEKLGASAHPVAAELRDERAIDRMFRAIDAEAGALDVLVNNACHLGLGHSALETPLEFFDEVLTVNLRAALQCCQQTARLMSRRSGGCIVNIGSNTARRAIRGRAAYITSKGGLEALTRALAVEWGRYGIRVNLLTPGYIRTDRWEDLPTDAVRLRRADLPLGREATPRDIGGAAVFLASASSGNMTGAEIVLDGGADAQLLPEGRDG